MPDTLPTGWRTESLGNLLTDEQIERVVAVLNSELANDEAVNELKRYFESIGDDLEKKGVLPAYLAYIVVFQCRG